MKKLVYKIKNKTINIKIQYSQQSNLTVQAKRQIKHKMSQMDFQNVQSQFKEKEIPYLNILKNLLDTNNNHEEIKDYIMRKTQKIQDIVYISLVQNQTKYLEKIGIQLFDKDLFTFIGTLMYQKYQIFQESIKYDITSIRSNIKPPPQPQPQPSQQLLSEVNHVLNNVDLPLSLFKRNDNYWSIDNAKTKQVNQYLKQLHEKDKKQKLQLRKKRDQIIKQKQILRNKTIDVIRQQQQQQKQQSKAKIIQKIQSIKKNAQKRVKSISQSVDFMKDRSNPLYKKITKQFALKQQSQTLEQKKRKLSEIRSMMRSVPLDEIKSHRQKYQQTKSNHQQKQIFNQVPKISFKSHFHQELTTKEQRQQISLYERKLEYAKKVKQQFKPNIDTTKQEEIQNRIKLMNKRRVRRLNRKTHKDQDDNDDDQEQEEQEEEQEEQEQQPQPEDDQDEDDEDRPKPAKDDQYQPDHKQRYKQGLNYLQIARKMATKKPSQNTSQISTSKPEQSEKKTISFDTTQGNNEGNVTLVQKQCKKKFIWVSKYDQQQKKQQRIKYRNYLHEMNPGTQPSGPLDTSRLQKQLQKSQMSISSRIKSTSANRYEPNRRSLNIESEMMYHTNLQNKIRSIEQRAKNQQQLLRVNRINRKQKIDRKIGIDNAVVDTIKARLLMMNRPDN